MSAMNQEFLNELAALANLLAGTSSLSVVAGKPGSGWSINLATGVISADAADLETRHPDFCRGLISHEIGHHLITRIHFLFPAVLTNPAYHALANVLEDIRLERYIGRRFPGTEAWARAYNNALLQVNDPEQLERLRADPVQSFLLGIVHRAWWGQDPDWCHEEAKAAIAEVWPSVTRIMETHPLLQAPLDVEKWQTAYESTDLPILFANEDMLGEPDAMEISVRLAQLAVWQETHQHVLPVFEQLLQKFGFKDAPAFGVGIIVIGSRRTRVPQEWLRMVRELERKKNPAVIVKKREEDLRHIEYEYYARDRGRYAAEIRRLARSLLDIATSEGKLKLAGAHASGSHVHLRRAIQAEADPRQLSRVWQKPAVPRRPDPHVILSVDSSASMADGNVEHSFAGVVILREACRLAGVPLSIIHFKCSAQLIESWDQRAPEKNIRPLVDALQPDGSTNMLEALKIARDHEDEAGHRDGIHIVISDGEPDELVPTRDFVQTMLGEKRVVIGLGLGPETRPLVSVIPGATVNLRPEELPDCLSFSLREAMAELYN